MRRQFLDIHLRDGVPKFHRSRLKGVAQFKRNPHAYPHIQCTPVNVMLFGHSKKLNYEDLKLFDGNVLMQRDDGIGTARSIELTENHVIRRRVHCPAKLR